ncbi:MAG: acyl-CoA thioesterase [Roseiflexaceae bacterium]
MPNFAQSFPYKVIIEVAFRDLDAMGHVNNAVYLSYMETARIKFLVDLLAVTSLHDLPVIMAEATCTFKAPAFFGELLTVGVGVSRFGSKSFDMAYQIDAGDGRLIALGRTVQVMYDYAAAQTIVMPEAFKAKILTFQGAWQAP